MPVSLIHIGIGKGNDNTSTFIFKIFGITILRVSSFRIP